MMNKTFYKKRRPVNISEVLKKVIGDLEKSKKTGSQAISAVIKRAMPAKVIRHMALQKRKGDTLIINFDNPLWLYEANKYKEKALEMIQRAQGCSGIRKISFRVGRVK